MISFYASARSLQLGAAVEVVAITSVAANLAAILGGILVFGDPIGSGPVGVTMRLLAFCLVIVGAAVMPAPARAIADRRRSRRWGLNEVAVLVGVDRCPHLEAGNCRCRQRHSRR